MIEKLICLQVCTCKCNNCCLVFNNPPVKPNTCGHTNQDLCPCWQCMYSSVWWSPKGAELNIRGVIDDFSYFSLKPYVVTSHLNCLIETVQMRGHNICFNAE